MKSFILLFFGLFLYIDLLKVLTRVGILMVSGFAALTGMAFGFVY